MGLVRLADRPPLQPLSELLARLAALEARLQGGGGPNPDRGAGPAGGGGPGRGPRRAAPGQAQAGSDQAHELRAAARMPPHPRRGDPSSPPRRALDGEVAADPPFAPPPSPIQASAAPTAAAPVVASAALVGAAEIPEAWQRIVATLQETQPALGAVLEHGVPVQVDEGALRISFPEGSFFGRQAMAPAARQALADAALHVLGRAPRIEIGFGLECARPTVAAVQAARQKEKRAEVVQAALSHPKVKDAMDVFPEAEGDVDVQVEAD
jgi:hypothetical protein